MHGAELVADLAAEEVRLRVRLAVHVQLVSADLELVAGKPDQALDEDAARARADACGLRRGLEDDDVAAIRVREAVDEPVGEHAVGDPRLAARLRRRAVQRRLHRGRRDPVRVHHPGLDGEHRRDRDRDRKNPVDDSRPGSRERFEPGAEEDGLLLPQAKPRERPVDGKHRSDEVFAVHGSPIAAVA